MVCIYGGVGALSLAKVCAFLVLFWDVANQTLLHVKTSVNKCSTVHLILLIPKLVVEYNNNQGPMYLNYL